MEDFQFRQCSWADCRFRFPVQVSAERSQRCPSCGSVTEIVGVPAQSYQKPFVHRNRLSFEALLDNIRSIHNVGSMFRTADGAGLLHLHLCGLTATPANVKLAKAALGAQEKVAWTHSLNGLDTVMALKENGYLLWALEAVENSEPFFTASPTLPHSRVVVIVGNENAGIDPGILQICDRVFSLPMYGLKRTLNVAVAFGIVTYQLCYAPQQEVES